MRTRLRTIVEWAEELHAKSAAGSEPSQYPIEAVRVFEAALELARAELGKAGGDEQLAAKKLRAAGEALLASVNISNEMIDDKKRLLKYSEHRRELARLVWLARTALVLEPDYYTEGAKAALRDQIDRAVSVLEGSYTVPFVRNRSFLEPRPDEDIQFATEYCTMAPSYGMTTYGLRPALEWYEYQHMRLQLASREIATAAYDCYLSRHEPWTVHYGKPFIEIDHDHTAYLGFAMPVLKAPVLKARIKLINHHIDGKRLFLHESADPAVRPEQLSFSSAAKDSKGRPRLGALIKSFYINFKDRITYIDITSYVNSAIASGKDSLHFQLVNEAGAVPCGFYSHTSPDGEKKPALELFYDRIDQNKLLDKARLAAGQARKLLSGAVAGASFAEYPEKSMKALREELSRAEESWSGQDEERSLKAIVRLYNAMREMRHACVLRTEAEPDATLFFPAGGVQQLKDKLAQSEVLQCQFAYLTSISDEQSLEDIKKYDRLLEEQPDLEQLNETYKLWSPAPVLTFTPPEGTVSGRLSFVLPSAEHEEGGGLGHVWLDHISIIPANAADILIENAGFEAGERLPAGWKPVARRGNPILKWEKRPNYVYEGTGSVYIANPTEEDEGAWEYEHPIPLAEGVTHTLMFYAKLDGKLKRGVFAELVFLDKEGRTLGTYTGVNNKKSMLGVKETNAYLRFQAEALRYAITGDRHYAEKAKAWMLWALHDFCQGAEAWLVTNLRPDGIDAYGAVQGGRFAAVLATAYSLIKHADVFTPEEHRQLLARVDYLLRDLIDLRDRTELGEYDAFQGTSNWHTDMSAGAALLALAIPELPNARQWFDNGRVVLKGQLDYHLNDDGSWPETIRYLYEVMMRFSLFAKALRNMTGENWFHGTKLAQTFEFLLSVPTPPYPYFDDKISTPNFGDHSLSAGREFAPLGIYTDEVAVKHPERAIRMVQVWERAGRPYVPLGGEGNALENFFAPLQYPDTCGQPPLSLASMPFHDQGLYLFRHRFGREDEGFVSIIANNSPIGHGHMDQGSFIFYANRIPLVADPGVESYFDSTFDWYKSSSAHSTVQFKNGSGYSDTPLTSSLEQFRVSELLDYARIAVRNPEGPGLHIRHIAYLKAGLGALVVWDEIHGAEAGTRFNLPILAAKESEITGSRIKSEGHFGTDLETVVLLPEEPEIKREWGRCMELAPKAGEAYQLDYIRVTAEVNQSYLCVLLPGTPEEKMSVTRVRADSEDVTAFEVSMNDARFVVALNNGERELAAALHSDLPCKDVWTGSQAARKEGEGLLVSLNKRELRVLVSTNKEGAAL